MLKRPLFGVLACLYTAQTMPGHFAANALPIILRQEGYSLEMIGCLGMISLPWGLKFLWAPLVDRFGGESNHYRKWVVAMQPLFALTTLCAALFSIREDIIMVAALMTLSYMFAATQDIAVDAYAAKTLEHRDRGVGNGIQTAGNMLGVVLGSSAALILYFHTSWGTTIAVLSSITMLLGLPILFTRERGSASRSLASYGDIISFFRIPGAARLMLAVFLVLAGVFSTMTMCKPLLVDKGYDWDIISITLGIAPISGVPTALITGFCIRRWGHSRVFAASCLSAAAACSSFIPISLGSSSDAIVYGALAGIHMAFAMLITVLYTIAMAFARPGREGSDIALVMSFSFIGGIAFVAVSGVVARIFGYPALFATTAALYIPVFMLSPARDTTQFAGRHDARDADPESTNIGRLRTSPQSK